MRNINESLEQIIENLLLIKNNSIEFSQIEKDILLQNLREAYMMVLQSPVIEKVQEIDNQEEREELKVEPKEEKVDGKKEDEPLAEAQNSEISAEKIEIETETSDSKTEEVPVEKTEEPLPKEEEEMDTDILEFIKDISQATVEVKPAHKEPELFVEAEAVVEPMPEPEPEMEVAPVSTPKSQPVIEEPEAIVEPEPMPEPKVEKFSAPKPQPTPEPQPAPKAKPTPQPVVEPRPEPTVIIKPKIESVPEPKPEPRPQIQAEAVKQPQQRSLNDLFNEQKQDLGDKFQQTKIADLTKAMSINDKFLFIRELFKNKSEEFSRAIQTLNKCENIEEAFDIMEGLKKQYFWDSTSSAYLALCDLVRRKF